MRYIDLTPIKKHILMHLFQASKERGPVLTKYGVTGYRRVGGAREKITLNLNDGGGMSWRR